MAGILDAFFNPTPEQRKGLQAAASRMLEMSGPSRVPVSFMQTVGAGMSAFDQGIQSHRDQEALQQHRAMQQQLLDWKVKDAEADFGHQQGARERQTRIAERVGKLYGSGAPEQSGSDAGGMPGAAPGANASPAYNSGGSPFQGAPGAAPSQASAAPQGVDWFKMGLPPATALSLMQGGGKRPNQTQQSAERLLAAADVYASEDDFDGAEKRYKAAAALMPQVDRIDIATDPQTNKPVRVITYKNGREEVSAFGAKRDMVDIDLGGVRKFVDRNQVQPGEEYVKSQTPDSRAVDTRFAARGAASGGGNDASLDADTLDMMADQALRGDTSVFKNLGRGAQGSANLVELRSRITQKAKALNISGADLAAITADYGGLVNGLRVSSNISARVENAISEARELAPLAVTAGREVARSGLLPFGKAQVMFDTQTNDPALKKFAAANVGFVQAYAGAMARGQKPTVHDKEHAEKLISEATSQKAYEAVMGQLMLEMDAASRAPQKVREHLRNEIGGRGGDHGGGDQGTPPGGQKTMTLNDIRETARRSGRTTAEVTAAARAKGYKIGGQ